MGKPVEVDRDDLRVVLENYAAARDEIVRIDPHCRLSGWDTDEVVTAALKRLEDVSG